MEAETVIDSYPLSPMQQGMLFHSIATREQGVDIEQILCRLREPMDAQAFERSWQHAIKRHAVLRTGFSGDASNEPRQQVYAIVRFGLVERDWRRLSAQEQQHRPGGGANLVAAELVDLHVGADVHGGGAPRFEGIREAGE